MCMRNGLYDTFFLDSLTWLVDAEDKTFKFSTYLPIDVQVPQSIITIQWSLSVAILR